MIYLDTHVIVRLYATAAKGLSDNIIQLIEKEQDIRISPMARLELEYLYEIGRVKESAYTIVNSLESSIGMTICNTKFSVISQMAEKLKWTRDPLDRLIVAHAKAESATLVTKDRLIHEHYENASW